MFYLLKPKLNAENVQVGRVGVYKGMSEYTFSTIAVISGLL